MTINRNSLCVPESWLHHLRPSERRFLGWDRLRHPKAYRVQQGDDLEGALMSVFAPSSGIYPEVGGYRRRDMPWRHTMGMVWCGISALRVIVDESLV